MNLRILDELERTVTDLMPTWTGKLTPWWPWQELETEDWLSEFQCELDQGGFSGGTLFAILIREIDPTCQLACALGVRALAHEIVDRAAKLLTYSNIKKGRECMRWCAAVCLGVIGPKANAAVPRLLSRLAKERMPAVRVVVAWALCQIDPRAARRTFVRAALFDSNCVIRHVAGNAIGRDVE